MGFGRRIEDNLGFVRAYGGLRTAQPITLEAGGSITGGTITPTTFTSDTIAEATAGAGVTVDGVLLKDGAIKTDAPAWERAGASTVRLTNDIAAVTANRSVVWADRNMDFAAGGANGLDSRVIGNATFHSGTPAGTVQAGIPVVYTFDLSNQVASTDLNPAFGIRITGATLLKTDGAGAAGDSVRLLNGASPITPVVNLEAVADQTVLVAPALDDGFTRVIAGGVLRVTQAGGTQNACEITVFAVRY